MAVGKYSIDFKTNLAEVQKEIDKTKSALANLEKKKIKLGIQSDELVEINRAIADLNKTSIDIKFTDSLQKASLQIQDIANQSKRTKFVDFAKQSTNAAKVLQTNIKRMGSAVDSGSKYIIQSFDKMLADVGVAGLASVMAKIGSEIEKGFSHVENTIVKNKDIFNELFDIFQTSDVIDFKSLFDGFVEGLKSITDGVNLALPPLKEFFAAFNGSNTIKSIGEPLTELSFELTNLAAMTSAIGMTAKSLQEVTKINTDGVYEKLTAMAVALGGMSLVGSAIEAFMNSNGSTMVKGLTVIASSAGVLVICGAALNQIAKMDGDFSVIPGRLGMMALGIGGMVIVAGAVEAFMNSNGSTMVKGLSIIVSSAGALLICGTVLNEIAKMDGDFSAIPERLGMMALGIGGMIIVAGAVEAFMNSNGSTMVKGLSIIVSSAGVLLICGTALNEIAKMDGNFNVIPERLGMMALGIGGMVIVAGAVEAFMNSNGSTMVKGLSIIASSAGVLLICGMALNEIAKMDGNFSAIPERLGMMALGIGGMIIVAGAVEAFMKKMKAQQ